MLDELVTTEERTFDPSFSDKRTTISPAICAVEKPLSFNTLLSLFMYGINHFEKPIFKIVSPWQVNLYSYHLRAEMTEDRRGEIETMRLNFEAVCKGFEYPYPISPQTADEFDLWLLTYFPETSLLREVRDYVADSVNRLLKGEEVKRYIFKLPQYSYFDINTVYTDKEKFFVKGCLSFSIRERDPLPLANYEARVEQITTTIFNRNPEEELQLLTELRSHLNYLRNTYVKDDDSVTVYIYI